MGKNDNDFELLDEIDDLKGNAYNNYIKLLFILNIITMFYRKNWRSWKWNKGFERW